jgi:hypothetical protein
LPSSFFQIIRRMSALAWVSTPAAVNAAAMRSAAAELAQVGRQVAEVAHHAGLDHHRALRRQPAEHAALADHALDRLLVAEAVLEADRHRLRPEHVQGCARRLDRRHRLGLDHHDVDRAEFGGVRGRPDRHRAVAAVADDPEAVAADRGDVLGVAVDQGDVEAAGAQAGAEQAADGAGADEGDGGFVRVGHGLTPGKARRWRTSKRHRPAHE